MQTPAPQAPAAAPVVAGPTSRSELIGIQIKQAEINRQISILSRMRERLSNQLPGKGGVDRAGVEQQITQLDKQIMQLQGQSDAIGQQIAAAEPRLLTGSVPPSVPPFIVRNNNDNEVPIAFFGFSFLLLFPFALVLARRMWRHTPGVATPVEWKDTPARLERLEQAVDTIAIEVERISESQRFMTRLMTEAASASPVPGARALGAADAPLQPARLSERERA